MIFPVTLKADAGDLCGALNVRLTPRRPSSFPAIPLKGKLYWRRGMCQFSRECCDRVRGWLDLWHDIALTDACPNDVNEL